MAELFCIIERREEILEKIDQAFDFVSLNCFFVMFAGIVVSHVSYKKKAFVLVLKHLILM